jgi:hypothetical protein
MLSCTGFKSMRSPDGFIPTMVLKLATRKRLQRKGFWRERALTTKSSFWLLVPVSKHGKVKLETGNWKPETAPLSG